ncbi:MAG: hypothetical protein DMF67_18305 [Acidobacteria bacterium]|nr:MAG: hypothetical protein DMF67_18305 [Acidobacteriota bacterium]
MPDYIPDSDADFDSWQQNLYGYVNSHLSEIGLTAADLTPLAAAQTTWRDAFGAHVTAQSAAQGARQSKDAARADLETQTRNFVRRVQGMPSTTDEIRASMGLPVRKEKAPTPVPSTRPVASVETDHRLRHTINFIDELTPGSKGKPDGVAGCEIWMKVGEAPAGPSQVTYLGTDTRTPYLVEHDETDAGKTAYYMLRWVNAKGEQGPWSHTVSATITG